jgi:hypothetical protein
MQHSMWRTIELGTGLKTRDDFCQAYAKVNCQVEMGGRMLLGNASFAVAKKKTAIDLVNMSVEELGFQRSQTYKGICTRARNIGLALCPAEVGPQLRLQYLEQPKGECLWIVMEPRVFTYNPGMPDEGTHLEIFRVYHAHRLCFGSGMFDIVHGTKCASRFKLEERLIFTLATS